jgi:uncharacterized membrane protein YjgN (DUF898 family)
MSAKEILVGALGGLLGLGLLLMLPLVWQGWLARREVRFRGRLMSHGDAAFMFWGGPILRRGLARCAVPLTIGWCGIVVGYWVAMANGGAAGASAPPVAKAAGVATAAWFAVWFVLAALIVLFNWPKLLVPPPQRAEPGAVADWRAVGRRRRRARSKPTASARRQAGP